MLDVYPFETKYCRNLVLNLTKCKDEQLESGDEMCKLSVEIC